MTLNVNIIDKFKIHMFRFKTYIKRAAHVYYGMRYH